MKSISKKYERKTRKKNVQNKPSEKIKTLISDIDFIISDKTTWYGLTKEERIRIMEENRILKKMFDQARKEKIRTYRSSEEYISAGFFKRLYLDFKYRVLYDKSAERKYDEETKQWYYTDGRTKYIIVEHFAENGKTFKELWLHAFLYEADQIEKKAKAEAEENGGKI